MDCVFCKIISGEFSSYKIYEDEECIGFLDINPINNGHVLVTPKKHFANMEETPDEVLFHLISVVKKLYEGIMKAVGADGITVVENYGLLQEVDHIHFHIIPTFKENPGVLFNRGKDLEDLELMAKKIRSYHE